ncbi:MAG TPA: alpha/beta fold hydrolase [Candidatus Eisenbacteria bacterium]|nr:alpha/beta fold hydrolase [Candidatus Eisenbacteria bacterium]
MARFAFGEFLLDIDEHRLSRNGAELRLRGKLFDTLCLFVQNPGRLLRKDEFLARVWPDSVVEENNLDHCVSQLRKILGGEVNQFIETVPRNGYRFVCPVRKLNVIELPVEVSNDQLWKIPELPPQEIRSFLTADGVNIAYSQCGAGPPLVKAANWLNHLEFEWSSPIWTHWVTELTRHHTLYRYDERGNGLSDWNIQDFSFPAWVRDFEQLIDTIQLDRFALLGISQGGAVAVSYAARHPERVSKLILYGAFSRGWMLRNIPGEIERRNALLTLVRLGWGRDNPAFRQLWTTLFMPDATPEQSGWFNELQRVTTSPENAVQLLTEGGRINVIDLLPRVQCPTLVLHSRDEAAVPVTEGRLLASRIPGAKFVELPSRNHLVIPQEPAWAVFLRALGEFLEWDNDAGLTSATRHAAGSP